jgi:tagatose-1,6-bisphosphate aldolase
MKAIITFQVQDEKIKEDAKREVAKRGQTLNAAMQQILEWGLEIYKERVPVKFTPVGDDAELSVQK